MAKPIRWDEAASLLPPLSTVERESLRASIEREGVLQPIVVLPDGRIIDGHHRWEAANGRAPVKVAGEMDDDAALELAVSLNVKRRNLSAEQRKELGAELRRRGWSQERVGWCLGVSDRTIRRSEEATGQTPGVSAALDLRVKVPPAERPVILERLATESAEQVAADYKITPRRVRQIAAKEERQEAAKRERHEKAALLESVSEIVHGDFRRNLKIDAGSAQLIFTDPPYDDGSIGTYADVASLAVHALVPGGWLLAYCGQAHLPAVFDAIRQVEGLEYGWMFAVLHAGGDLRFRKFKLQNGWKPIIGFYKPPLNASWDWFKDVCSGGKEKDQHEWQQAESEAAYFIDKLTTPDGLVVDPMCGSGTTLAAAKSLGRRWLGCEALEEHVTTARARLV